MAEPATERIARSASASSQGRNRAAYDLENVPAFWIAGLLFVAVDPALWLAQVLMYGFVVARAAHFWAYATKQSHEVRATFYTIGSLIVIYMACQTLWAALV